MKNTPSYAPRFHGQTNEMGVPAEETAIWNVTQEERIREITERVERAISRLPKKEEESIRKRYLEDDNFDYLVALDVGLSDRTYTRVKARAFYKLAFMLKFELVVEEAG